MAATYELEVHNLPRQELAYSNCVYVSPSFFSQIKTTDGPKWGEIGHNVDLTGIPMQVKNMVYNVRPHEEIPDGKLGVNSLQRRDAQLSVTASVALEAFSDCHSNATAMNIEIDFMKKKNDPVSLDYQDICQVISDRYFHQVFTIGQAIPLEYSGIVFKLTIKEFHVGSGDGPFRSRAILTPDTNLTIQSVKSSPIRLSGQTTGSIRVPEFNFQKLGIGGLDREFSQIFRRAFASRVFPPAVIERLGIKHVRGMILYGPPGCGKTLIARKIGEALGAREPKIVNGPEILNKYVGQSEENIRNLFLDAEEEYRRAGDDSELHIIIFDEIDAICKSRGSTKDNTGVSDSIVNQLLSKIDGVDSLNNILLIGMTNRIDMIDEALLRPGRLEVRVEIGLPDETGRLQILNIHTSAMRKSNMLSDDVELSVLAERTKNFSGAEIEGLTKSASSFALNRHINLDDLTKTINPDDVKVCMQDFERALSEVVPSFGASTDDLHMCFRAGIISGLSIHSHVLETLHRLTHQVQDSNRTPLLSVLLEGPPGSGKTAIAAKAGVDSDFPFVKIISPEQMVAYTEMSKCSQINKVFQDSYKSNLSVVIIDNLERLLDYVPIGPRFSNMVLQTLMVLIKRVPPTEVIPLLMHAQQRWPKKKTLSLNIELTGRKLLVIATTSESDLVDTMGLRSAFNVCLQIPKLHGEDVKKVVNSLCDIQEEELDTVVSSMVDPIDIKKIHVVVEMARQESDTVNAATLIKCLEDCGH